MAAADRILVPLACVGAVACGGGSGASTAGGAPDLGADLAPSPDLPPPAPDIQGVVRPNQLYMNTMDMWMAGADADFYRAQDFSVPTPDAIVGACFVYAGAANPGNTGATLDAGPVTLRGGVRDVHFARRAGGYRSDVPRDADHVFSDGDALHVEAAGGADVPAFAVDLVAPARLAVWNPELPRGLDVDRAMDFRTDWTPGRSGDTDVFFELTDGDTTIACGATDESGTLTVPSAALGHLHATSRNGMYMLTRTAHAHVLAGPATVSLEAATTECCMGSIR